MIDILIPTYNRAEFLKKNILMLNRQINERNLGNYYKIIISDNNSKDNTWDVIGELKNEVQVEIEKFRQVENIGLEPNAVFLLEKSRAEYVMYLGDDDYLPDGYLEFVVKIIQEENAECVIPGFSELYSDGSIKPARYSDFEIRRYEPGFDTVCKISNFGHQLSGLVTRRESLFEEYTKEEKYRNIYPFVFFVTYCMLQGVTYFVPKYQVLVSQNNSKDWKYDASGLLLDIFRNYKIAFSNDRDKLAEACLSFARIQSWRLRVSYNPINAFRSFFHLIESKEVDNRIKVALIWLYLVLYCKGVIITIKNKFGFLNKSNVKPAL